MLFREGANLPTLEGIDTQKDMVENGNRLDLFDL
jgi:hypothetical protein